MQGRLHFEDFSAGDVDTYGSHLLTDEAIVPFAQEYDPQPFHLDDEAGRPTMLGRAGGVGLAWLRHPDAAQLRRLPQPLDLDGGARASTRSNG